MYRRPKFLEVLLDIRREMARDADYDTELFAEMIRTGRVADGHSAHSLAYGDEDRSNGSPGAKRSATRKREPR